MVKALDLSSNVRMHTWVRTPFLVEWDPGDASFLLFYSSFFYFFQPLPSFYKHTAHLFTFSSTLHPTLAVPAFFEILWYGRSKVTSIATCNTRLQTLSISRNALLYST